MTESAASDEELSSFGRRMEQFCAEIVAAWRDVLRGGIARPT